MPTSIAARTIERTADTPATWPAERGRCRLRAQRPFPSMMIATWRGSVSGPSGTFFAIISSLDSGPRASDLHDLVLLILERVVNVVDMGVRHLLQFLAQPAVIILADLMVLFALFQELPAVPADVT